MSTSITISKQIAIKDEGVLKTSDVNSIDFTGAGITTTNVGNAVTVNVPGSAGGGGVHVLTTPISNRTYSVRTSSTSAFSSSSFAGNSIQLYPFIPAKSLTIKNLVLNIASLTVGGLIRALIYSDLNGVPSSKLLESTSLDCSTTGDKIYVVSFTFTAGTTYWLGAYSNLATQVAVISLDRLIPISNNDLYGGFCTLNTSVTFPNAPATLGGASLSTSPAISINLTAV